MKPPVVCFCGIYVVLLGLSGPVNGQVLFGISHKGNQFITIDPATGAGALVGTTTTDMRALGLGFRGTKLYTWDANAFRIQELDPATGATLNTIDIGSTAFGEGDMTFRSDGIGFISAVVPSQLTRFDITIPNSSVVAPLNPKMDGLAFNSAGVMYGLREGGQELYTIDPTTAITTLVGNTGITGFSSTGGGALAFDASDKLYAVLTSSNASPSLLFKVDVTTAAGTLVGPIGFNGLTGLAFQPVPAPSPPPSPPSKPSSGSGPEGDYVGSQGGSGIEGAFGLGGKMSQKWGLLGPFAANDGRLTVRNIAHQGAASSNPGAETSLGNGTAFWAIVSALVLCLVGIRSLPR